ncbi:MAG: TAXI family TRAP transporter solute-binding subunit [Xenococcaceae cyanobacterium]
MKKIISLLIVAAFTPFALIGCNPKTQESTTPEKETAVTLEELTILTANKDGNYYKAAQEMNEVLKQAGLSLNIKTSPGSYENIKELGAGNADLAFSQFDARGLINDLGTEEDKKLLDNTRFLAPISNEVIHIIINKSSGIETVADLNGKKVALGPPNSGTRVSALLILVYNDIYLKDNQDNFAVTLEVEESIKKVISGELDAAFYTTTPGAPLLKKISANEGRNIEILSIDDLSFIPESANIYIPGKIPGKTYPWQQEEVGVIATFSYILVNQSLEPEKVYEIAKTIYNKASELKANNPFWAELSIDAAQRDISIYKLPYHPGVVKFIEEQ